MEWHFERAKEKLDKECGESINAESMLGTPAVAGASEALAGGRDSGQYVQLASNGQLVSKDALTQSGASSTPNRGPGSRGRRTPMQRELTDGAMTKTKSSVMEIKNSTHSIYLDQARQKKNVSPYSFQRANDSELSMNALQIQGTLVGTAAERVDLFASTEHGLGLDSTCQMDRQSLFEVKIQVSNQKQPECNSMMEMYPQNPSAFQSNSKLKSSDGMLGKKALEPRFASHKEESE